MDHVSHCGTFGNAPFLDSDMFAHFLKKKLWAPSKAPFSTVHRAVVRYMREITLGDKGSTGILAMTRNWETSSNNIMTASLHLLQKLVV